MMKPRVLVVSTHSSHLSTLAYSLLARNFQNISCMSGNVFRINDDVVQIYHYADVQQVLGDVVQKEAGALVRQ